MMRARIVAVEDEAVVALDLSARLQVMGYQVVGMASSAASAVACAAEAHPDVVLMDIHLQGGSDGISAADEIRRRCDIPVVFLTAHSDEATLQRAKVAEPYGYVLKPFEDRELLACIEVAIFKHAAEAKRRGAGDPLRVDWSQPPAGGGPGRTATVRDAKGPVTARLIIRAPGVDAVASLGDEPLSVGRDPAAGLVLDGPGVSRRHCVIEPRPDRGHRVRDDGSTNGVYLNDRRVACASLESFDRVRLGEFVLVYVDVALDVAKVRGVLAPSETSTFGVGATREGRRLDQLVWLTLMVQDASGCGDLPATVTTLLDDLAAMSGDEAQALVVLEPDVPGEPRSSELRLGPAYGARVDPPALEACLALARRAVETGLTCDGPTPGAHALCIPMHQLPRGAGTEGDRRRGHQRRSRGALVLLTGAPLALEPGEDAVLGALARQLAVLIGRDRLERLAAVDPLTGLYTRAWLEENLPAELSDPPAALLLIDVDDFKLVNDAHGHAAGDEVLRALGEQVRASIRESDWAGRWGGDELVVALPGTDQAGAWRVAQALLAAVSAQRVGDGLVRPSISIGIGLSPLHGKGLLPLLRCADEALYAAKRAGKGRIAVHEPQPAPPAEVELEATRKHRPRTPSAAAWLHSDLLPPVVLRQGPTSLGRGRTCDVVLPHPLVSRRHGVVRVDGARLAFDDESKHGSWLNGTPIRGSTPLAPGDRLRVGPYVFTVHDGVPDRDASFDPPAGETPADPPGGPPTARLRAPRKGAW